MHANRLNGIDAEWLEPDAGRARSARSSNVSPDVRYPVLGATLPARAAGSRAHENVAWGFARAADALGVDLIQGCEVTGIEVQRRARRRGRDHRAAGSRPGRSRSSPPGTPRCSRRWPACGCRSRAIRCRRSSPSCYEQVLDTVVMSNAVHVYVSQAHKGELVMGAGIDSYNSYAQRGSFHVIEHQLAAALELFPIFAHARVLRTWAGIVDVCPDASPIVGPDARRGPVRQLRLGHRRLQGDARLGLGVRLDDRPRRAARAERAVLARPLHDRRADRRARRRRRSPTDAADPLPVVRRARRDRVLATAARPTSPTRPTRRRSPTRSGPQFLFFRDNPKGALRGAVGAHARLPPLVRPRPRHGRRTRSPA